MEIKLTTPAHCDRGGGARTSAASAGAPCARSHSLRTRRCVSAGKASAVSHGACVTLRRRSEGKVEASGAALIFVEASA